MFASTLNSRRIRSTSTSRCSSPMPEMMVWPVSSSVLTWKVGSSSASRWMAVPSFSWSLLVLGSMATLITGAGNVIDSRTTWSFIAQSVVAGGGVFQAHHRNDLPGHRERALLALVRVHLVDLADPLPAALDGVHHGAAGLQGARVDADVGELAEMQVRHDLERQGGERGFGGRRALHHHALV